jgi:hypothetical protein
VQPERLDRCWCELGVDCLPWPRHGQVVVVAAVTPVCNVLETVAQRSAANSVPIDREMLAGSQRDDPFNKEAATMRTQPAKFTKLVAQSPWGDHRGHLLCRLPCQHEASTANC